MVVVVCVISVSDPCTDVIDVYEGGMYFICRVVKQVMDVTSDLEILNKCSCVDIAVALAAANGAAVDVARAVCNSIN
jgi:hypothetical protein